MSTTYYFIMVNGLPFILVYVRGSTWDLNSNKKGSVNFHISCCSVYLLKLNFVYVQRITWKLRNQMSCLNWSFGNCYKNESTLHYFPCFTPISLKKLYLLFFFLFQNKIFNYNTFLSWLVCLFYFYLPHLSDRKSGLGEHGC